MDNYLTDSFFKFLLGFVIMLGISFVVIFGVDYYSKHIDIPEQMAAAARESRVPALTY